MKTLAKAGTTAILVAWFGATVVQALAAEKRVTRDADCMRPADRIVAAATQPRDVCATPGGNVTLLSPNGALVLNRVGGDLLINESWIGGTGNWNTASDWNPSGIPNNGGGNTYNVTIDSGGTDLVSLNMNATISSLVLGGSTGSSTLQNLSGTPETLEVTGTTTINTHGNLTFGNGSTLKFDGGLTVAGSLDLTSATMATITGTGLFNSGSSVDLAGGSALTVNGNLTNNSTLATGYFSGYGGGNTLTVTGGFTNNGSLTMYGTNYYGGGGDMLNVTGTLTNSAGASLALYDNSGDMAKVGTLTNLGSIYVGTGTRLNLTNQPSGITDVPAHSSLTVNGSFTAGSASGLANLGSVEGTLTLANGQMTADAPGSGTLTVASGGSLTLSNTNGATTLSVTGGLSDSGSVTVGTGTTLNLTQSMTDLPATGTLVVSGTMNGLSKLTSVEGSLYLLNGQTTAVTPGGTPATLTLNSHSSTFVDAGSTLTVNGNLTNAFGSSLSTGYLYGGGNTVSVGGNLANSGALAMYGSYHGGGGDMLYVTGTLTNNAGATLDLVNNSGDIANIGTLSNSGSVYVGSGTTLNLTNQPNGITDAPAGSSLAVYGTLSPNALAKLASIEGTLTLGNGQTTSDTPSGGTLTVASGGSLTLNNTNGTTTLSVTGGLSDSGSVSVGTGTSLNLTQNMTDLPATGTLTVSGAMNGLAKLTSVEGTLTLGNGQTISDTPNGGTLAVASGGSLTLNNTNGATTLSVTGGLSDSGSVTVGTGTTLTLTRSMTDLPATGTLTVSGTMNGLALAKLTSVEGALYLINGQTYSVTPGGTPATLTLSSGSSVFVGTASTLTVNGNLTNNSSSFSTGWYTYGGANTLTVTGGFTNSGAFSMYGGCYPYSGCSGGAGDTLKVTGTLTNNAGASLTLFDNSGDAASVGGLNNSGSLYIGVGTSLNLTNQPSGITDVPARSSLTVNGSFTAGSANALANLGSVEGTLTLANGQMTADTPGSGTLTVASGGSLTLSNTNGATTLSVTGGLSDSGSVTVGAGTTLNLTQSMTDVPATGTLTVSGSMNGLSKLTSVEGALYLVNGQATSVTPAGTPATLTLNYGSTVGVSGGSTLTVNGNLTNSSASFYTGYYGGGNTLTVSGGFTNNGSLTMYGPYPYGGGADTLTVTGTLTNSAGAHLTLADNSGDVASVGKLSNAGALYVGTGTTLDLTNQPNGITDVPARSSLTVNGSFTAGTANALANLGSVEGTLALANGQTTADTPRGGTLTVASGGSLTLSNTNGATTLSVTGGLSDSGSVTVGTGTTLDLTRSMTDLPATASLYLYGTTNGLAKLTSVEGALYLVNGQTTAVRPGGTPATLSLNSGSTAVIGGGSTLTVNGNLANASTSFYTGYYYGGGNTLTVNGGFTNSSALTMYGAYPYGGKGDTLSVTGTLTNNAGASLTLYDNSGDVARAGTLVNSGSVYIGSGTTLTLTNQPNGITDVPASSSLTVNGKLKAGTANGLANLGSVEGELTLGNGQTTADRPGTGTLTVASGGSLTLNNTNGATTLSVTGGLSDSGSVTVGTGTTLKLTQSMTDLPATGTLTVSGTMNGLSKLTSVEGVLYLINGQTTAVTPGGTPATLSLNSGSTAVIGGGSTLTVNGNLTNASTTFYTGYSYGGGNTLTVTGGFTNSGSLTMYGAYPYGGAGDTLKVTGTLTNNAGASLSLYNNSGDTANVGTLSNAGSVYVGTGTTLNLTNQPNGITDVPVGSALTVNGTLTAGSVNGLANLTSVEGTLTLGNGQTTVDTPSGGTLTVAPSGGLALNNVGTALSVNGGLTVAESLGLNSATATITGNGTFYSSSSVYLAGGSTLAVNGNLTNNSTNFYTGYYGGGNTLTVGGGFTNNGSLIMDGGYPSGGGGDTLNVTGALTNSAGASLTFYDSSGDLASAATLSNSGTVYIGSGTVLNLTASGTNTNSGTINLGSSAGPGTLQITSSAVTLSGAGTVAMSNSVITATAAADTLTSANTIEGSGNIGNGNMGFVNTGTVLANQSTPLVIDPSSSGFNNQGTLNVSAGDTLEITGPANSFLNYNSSTSTLTGGTYLVAGTLQFGAAGNTVVTNAANITLIGSGANIVDPSDGNIIAPLATNATGALFDISGGANFTTQGNFTNNGTLYTGYLYGGGNTLTVNGGLTNGGTLTMYGSVYGGSGDTLNVTGMLTNNEGASLTLADNSGDVANVGTLSNSGTVYIGSGTVLNLTASGTDTNSGTINVGSLMGPGTLEISASAVTLSGSGNVIMSNFAGNVITAAASTDILTNAGTIEGSGNIGNGAMGFVNSGTVLANQSTPLIIDISSAGFNNTGTLNVSSGDLMHVKGGPFTNFNGGTLTGGAYNVSGTLEIDQLGSAGGEIVTNAANIILNGTASSFVDAAGLDALTKLNANSTGAGFTVTGGQALTDSATKFSNAGTLTVGTGSALTLSSTKATYTQTGGTTTVDGTLTAKGGMTFSGGSIFGNGGTFNAGTNTLTNSATFNIGDATMTAGKEAITGAYTQSSTGVLDIDIGGLAAGTQFDQLNISGAASLNGTLNLDLINGFVPSMGNTFDIINFASETGQFSSVTGTGINSGEHFTVVYNTTNVTLDVVAGAAPGTAFSSGFRSSPSQPGNPTPEPPSLFLLGSGLLGLGAYLRRAKRARK